MNNITKIMALGIWEVGAADCLNKADADFYARQAITALKAAGYAIVPVEPSEAMIEAIGEVFCEEGYGDRSSPEIYSSHAKESWAAAIKAGDKS